MLPEIFLAAIQYFTNNDTSPHNPVKGNSFMPQDDRTVVRVHSKDNSTSVNEQGYLLYVEEIKRLFVFWASPVFIGMSHRSPE